jgi:Rad3-related DNA helicase
VCAEIEKLAQEHPGKGLVHITYGLIPHFKKYLTDERYLWHTPATRGAVYEEFIASTEPRILMACGMAEGIDLAGPDYQWQVIAKIQFPSLMDALVRRQKEAEPEWYDWQTIKTTIQQTGRICRSVDDYGVTYILDSSFEFLFNKRRGLFPKYIQQAMIQSRRT